ncbi:hypothetical protein D918_06615 [Trichuris suis]|nr:hypothetical protein D918_06615 [Trichuris suis]
MHETVMASLSTCPQESFNVFQSQVAANCYRFIYYARDRPQTQGKTAPQPLEDWEILDTDDFHLSCVSECETQKSQNAVTTDRSTIPVLFGFLVHDLLCLGRSGRPEVAPEALSKKPLTVSEFREFVDDEGRLMSQEQFRLRVYQGGCEKRLRATVWPLLLDVFPPGMNMVDRCSYLAVLSKRYINLRNAWCVYLRSHVVSEQVRWIINSIRRDVIRTDRMHPFYAGDEEHNPNLVSLFNVLATYALYHPEPKFSDY